MIEKMLMLIPNARNRLNTAMMQIGTDTKMMIEMRQERKKIYFTSGHQEKSIEDTDATRATSESMDSM